MASKRSCMFAICWRQVEPNPAGIEVNHRNDKREPLSQATWDEECAEIAYRSESLRRWSMREQATANDCKCVGQFVCRRCKGDAMSEDDMAIIGYMRHYGDNFIKQLCHLMLIASPSKFQRLRTTFEAEWNHYAALKAEGQQQIDQALRKPE